MRKLFSNLGWCLVSPTRKIIDQWKVRGDRKYWGNALRRWSLGLFCAEAVACASLMLLFDREPSNSWSLVSIALVYYACSRIIEIAYAFYRDPLTQSKDSDLKVGERIVMAMRSYFGLAFNFALLYYFLPIDCFFKVGEQYHLSSFVESFYFSSVTIATLGYGDVVPIHWGSRLLAVGEVFTGIFLIAIAIAVYAGGMKVEEAQPTVAGDAAPKSGAAPLN